MLKIQNKIIYKTTKIFSFFSHTLPFDIGLT